MGTIIALGVVVLGALAFLAAAFVRGQKAGQADQENVDLIAVTDLQKREAEAATKAPADKSELEKSLKDGSF